MTHCIVEIHRIFGRFSGVSVPITDTDYDLCASKINPNKEKRLSRSDLSTVSDISVAIVRYSIIICSKAIITVRGFFTPSYKHIHASILDDMQGMIRSTTLLSIEDIKHERTSVCYINLTVVLLPYPSMLVVYLQLVLLGISDHS